MQDHSIARFFLAMSIRSRVTCYQSSDDSDRVNRSQDDDDAQSLSLQDFILPLN